MVFLVTENKILIKIKLNKRVPKEFCISYSMNMKMDCINCPTRIADKK
jgi:hypothetical protein